MNQPKKILVIEDNPHTRFLVNAILQSVGCTVIEAEDGQKGLERVQDPGVLEGLNAIFLDILMPHVNGLEVLTKLKADPKVSSVPVVMLTTRDMADDIIKGYSIGADYYIPKPFTREQLLYGLNLVLGDGEVAAPDEDSAAEA